MTGVVIAHYKELKKIDKKLIDKKTINQFDFYHYKINDKDVVFVLSGVGIANSAAATQELISSFKVKEIWNYGSVGGNKHVDVYDLVAPSKIYYHDVFTPWYKLGQTPGEKEYYTNDLQLEKNNILGSGSSFVNTKETIVNLKKELNIDIFDMEGAAIAQICDKNNVPVKIIKCVSDSIGHTNVHDHGDILMRIENAGQKAFDKMLELL